LIGILDLVQQKQIIDYKTSGTTPNADKVAHTTEIQTSSYAILYRHNTGVSEAGIQLHHLVKLKNPKVVITTLPPMNPGSKLGCSGKSSPTSTDSQRKDFIPSPGMHCSSCEFFNECRQWH
jgi:putative RecB family exonuclease